MIQISVWNIRRQIARLSQHSRDLSILDFLRTQDSCSLKILFANAALSGKRSSPKVNFGVPMSLEADRGLS